MNLHEQLQVPKPGSPVVASRGPHSSNSVLFVTFDGLLGLRTSLTGQRALCQIPTLLGSCEIGAIVV